MVSQGKDAIVVLGDQSPPLRKDRLELPQQLLVELLFELLLQMSKDL